MSTIGESTAPSQHTINYDALLSTTLMAYRDTMVDNIFLDSAFLAAMREFGGVDRQDGGERIAMPLMHGKNDTIKSHEGYDVIDTTPQEGITTAFYEWKELAGSVSISRKEERQNSGEARLINLLESKVKQAEMSMREELNLQLLQGTQDNSDTEFNPGNAGKDLNPVGYFLRKDNTANPNSGGNVGNISASAESWWRHRTAVADSASTDTGNDFALSVSTYAGLKVAMRRMHNFCARGSGGAPNLLVADQISFETYENALDVNVRFQNTRLADLGFETIKVKGSTMIWDEKVPSIDTGDVAAATNFVGTIFYLNTRFMKIIFDSQTDIITTPFIEPENQTAKVAKILAMLNLGCSSLRKQGVLYAVSQSIVS